ncbi:hypothetical protein F5X96DRAFT_142251 [Biscogniauxia mediterranea]|nr:hypothetical protein F5X96DRAFT_142251 [Biscogniauxia mediterranea]
MPRYITPSPSTSRSCSRSRSRSYSRSQSSFRRGRSIDSSYRGRRTRSPSSSVSPSTAHDAKEKTVVKSSLAFLGAIGAASLIAHKCWPKGVLYGEKEEWAAPAATAGKKKKNSERTTVRTTTTARRMPDAGAGHGGGNRRQKFEWEDGMTSESRRLSNVGRQSFSEMGENYHYALGGGSGNGSGSGSGSSSGRTRSQRPRIYQDAAVVETRRRSSAAGLPDRDGDLKYIETQAPGPHAIPRRYIVDDNGAVVPRRSARRYSVIER